MPAGKTPRDHTAFRFELNAAALSYGVFHGCMGVVGGDDIRAAGSRRGYTSCPDIAIRGELNAAALSDGITCGKYFPFSRFISLVPAGTNAQ